MKNTGKANQIAPIISVHQVLTCREPYQDEMYEMNK